MQTIRIHKYNNGVKRSNANRGMDYVLVFPVDFFEERHPPLCSLKHTVAIMHRHSSHNTTTFANFYIAYQLHVSAISDLAIIRLDTIVTETI